MKTIKSGDEIKRWLIRNNWKKRELGWMHPDEDDDSSLSDSTGEITFFADDMFNYCGLPITDVGISGWEWRDEWLEEREDKFKTEVMVEKTTRRVIELSSDNIEDIISSYFKFKEGADVNFDWHIGQWVSLTIIETVTEMEEIND